VSERAIDSPLVQIRELVRTDLAAVLAIESIAFSTPWRQETFESLLERDDTDMVAAVQSDRLVGYAVCWTVIDQSELGNVAVAPAVRGQGVGRLLVNDVLSRVRSRGARECFLEVRASNSGARRLYESMGFTVIGKRRDYYRKPIEDALVMRLGLS
jgi:[ribosomal protein S18]-alanine N-acetyltransferase